MISVFVNDNEVNLNYVLKNKDRVRIITSELTDGPTNEWLEKYPNYQS